MKFSFVIILFLLAGCYDKPKSIVLQDINISKAQTGIQSLVDSFKIEYSSAKTQLLQDSTIDKYNVKLLNFLSNHSIDSIKVHVDTVIINGWKITTKFHCNRDIVFQYGLTFEKSMPNSIDSLFQFMKGLKIGSDTIINFSYMGSHQFNNLNDTLQPTLRIFAFPTPLLPKSK
jgi:hypothetical protein